MAYLAEAYLRRKGLPIKRYRPRVYLVAKLLHIEGEEYPYAQALVDSDSGRMAFVTKTAKDIHTTLQARKFFRGLPGKPGKPPPIKARAVAAVLHEVIHLVAPEAREPLVEAVAQDETPRFVKYLTGVTIRYDRSFDSYDTSDVLSESARAARSKPFTRDAERERIKMLRKAMALPYGAKPNGD
jgi:hypothetical protein